MSYRLVYQLQKEAIPVKQTCRVLSVSRSGYYEARRRSKKPALCKTSLHLKAVFMASHQSLWKSSPGHCDAKSGNSDWSVQSTQFNVQSRTQTGLETKIYPYDT